MKGKLRGDWCNLVCGYNSKQYFYRLFRKDFELSYRDRTINDIGSDSIKWIYINLDRVIGHA